MSISKTDFQKLLGVSWGRSNISYSFFGPGAPLPLPSYYTNYLASHSDFYTTTFGSSQGPGTIKSVVDLEGAFRLATQAWMAVANINLTENTSSVGDIAVGRIPFQFPPRKPGTKALTFKAPEEGGLTAEIRGDIWFGTDTLLSTPYLSNGGIGLFSILHEIGHALGLYGDDTLLGNKYDSWRYSVMSYNDTNFKNGVTTGP